MQDLRISLIQTELIWENPSENIRAFTRLLSDLETTDVVILPEMFTTGFSMNPSGIAEKSNGPTTIWMANMAKQLNAALCGSIIIEEGGKYYNRLIWMNPDGSNFIYDKRHLFTLAGEEKIYTAGTEKIVVEYKGWRVCPLICYDLRFPVWSRNDMNYDLLIYVANWPERRVFAWQQLLIARAIENQCYVAGVNRVGKDGNEIYHSGHSALIDSMGETLSQLIDKNGVLTSTLSAKHLAQLRAKLPFQNDRDEFEIRK